MIERALRTGYRMRSCCCSTHAVRALRRLAPEGVPVYRPGTVMRSITGYRLHRGMLASFDRRPLPTVAEVAARRPAGGGARRRRQPTNLGAVVRSARPSASTRCCSTRPPATRCTGARGRIWIGEVFEPSPGRLEPLPEGAGAAAGGRASPCRPHAGRRPPSHRRARVGRHDRVAVLLGTEGAGLSAAVLRGGQPARPHPDGRGATRSTSRSPPRSRSTSCAREPGSQAERSSS